MLSPGLAVGLVLAELVVFVVVAAWAASRPRDVEDYVVARGSQAAPTLGLSFFAAGLGAWILYAPPEVGAGVGLVAVVGYAVGAAAPFLALAVLGPRLRRVAPGGHGIVEFLRLRFGRPFHAYVVVVSIAYMFCFLTAELTAVGGVGAILAGVDPRVVVVAVAVATLAYTTWGGLRASLVTDRFQAWLIVGLGALALAAVAVRTEGAPEAFARSGLLGARRVGVEAAVTLVIAVTAANLFHQGYWQRVWAARDDVELRRGAVLGGALAAPVVLAVGAVGILAAGTGRDLGDPPLPLFALLGSLPGWALATVLVLGVALAASSIDTLETGLASLVAAELRTRTLLQARVVTVLLVVPAVAVALQSVSVLRLFLIADLLCAATIVPALLALWPRATGAAALAGAVAGLAGAVLPGWVVSGSLGSGLEAATFPGAVPTLPPFLGALLASTVVAVAWSLVQRGSVDLADVGDRVPVLGAAGAAQVGSGG